MTLKSSFATKTFDIFSFLKNEFDIFSFLEFEFDIFSIYPYPLHGDSPDQHSAGPHAGAEDDEEYAEFSPDQVEEKPVLELDSEVESDIEPNTSAYPGAHSAHHCSRWILSGQTNEPILRFLFAILNSMPY